MRLFEIDEMATPLDETRAPRLQTAVAILVLMTAGATFGALALAARSESLERFLFNREYERFKEGREHFMNRGLFAEFEDRLLLDVIPSGDCSKGGVFFLGTSAMKWALKPSECLDDARPTLHNYCIGATNHAMQFEFVRYLVERHGMLVRKPDDVHVVLGLYCTMGLSDNPERYWQPLWRRYGLYDYNPGSGVSDVEMPPGQHALFLERARVCSFLSGMANRAAREISLALGIRISATERLENPAIVREFVAKMVGQRSGDGGLATQMQALRGLIRFLQDRNVRLTCVVLPHRAAMREMAWPKMYFDKARGECQGARVPFIDMSATLSEEEYWDINHSNYGGLEKTHRALLEVAQTSVSRGKARPTKARVTPAPHGPRK